jgi:putative hemolysin
MARAVSTKPRNCKRINTPLGIIKQMRKSFLVLAFACVALLLSGCIQGTGNGGQQLVGNDADEHGCIPSAGYSWCEAKQKCIRPWEEECVAENNGQTGLPNPASVYCENQGGSLRIEDNDAGQVGICTLADGSECEEWAYYRGECPIAPPGLLEKAGEFCNTENLAGIYVCGDYVKVVSSLLGGGSTYYKLSNGRWATGIQCPVIGPDSMTEECKTLAFEQDYCIEKQCAVPAEGIEAMAREFCSQANVASVFVCGEYAEVVSSMLGGGSTFYKLESNDTWGNEVQCPVVGPDSITEECRLLAMGSNCIRTQAC